MASLATAMCRSCGGWRGRSRVGGGWFQENCSLAASWPYRSRRPCSLDGSLCKRAHMRVHVGFRDDTDRYPVPFKWWEVLKAYVGLDSDGTTSSGQPPSEIDNKVLQDDDIPLALKKGLVGTVLLQCVGQSGRAAARVACAARLKWALPLPHSRPSLACCGPTVYRGSVRCGCRGDVDAVLSI